MKHLIIFFMLLFSYAALAQSNKDIAKAYYISAEEAYSEGNFGKCLELLNKCESALGFSGTNLEYLRVKSLMNNKEWDKAKLSSEKYFNLATEKDKSTDKYMEMVKSKIQIDEAIVVLKREEIEKQQMYLAQKKFIIEEQKKRRTNDSLRFLKDRRTGIIWSSSCIGAVILGGVLHHKGVQLQKEYDRDMALNKPYNPKYKSSKPSGDGYQISGGLLMILGGLQTIFGTGYLISTEIQFRKFKKNKNVSYSINKTIINNNVYNTFCFNYRF